MAAPGTITAVVGLSGVGKTTLIRLLAGLNEFSYDGEVTFQLGAEVFQPLQARSQGILAMLAQDAGLVPWLTAHSNLMLPASLNTRLSSPQDSTVRQILAALGLHETSLAKFPHELSYGMQRRVSAARAFLYSPRFILLDETFTGLDPVSATALEQVIVDEVKAHSITCIMVTHDVERSCRLASTVYILRPTGSLEKCSIRSPEYITTKMSKDTEAIN